MSRGRARSRDLDVERTRQRQADAVELWRGPRHRPAALARGRQVRTGSPPARSRTTHRGPPRARRVEHSARSSTRSASALPHRVASASRPRRRRAARRRARRAMASRRAIVAADYPAAATPYSARTRSAAGPRARRRAPSARRMRRRTPLCPRRCRVRRVHGRRWWPASPPDTGRGLRPSTCTRTALRRAAHHLDGGATAERDPLGARIRHPWRTHASARRDVMERGFRRRRRAELRGSPTRPHVGAGAAGPCSPRGTSTSRSRVHLHQLEARRVPTAR